MRYKPCNNFLVNSYQKNNYRNIFALYLLINKYITPVLLIKNYNIIIDINYLLSKNLYYIIYFIKLINLMIII